MMKRVAKNTFFLLLAQIGAKIINFLYLLFLARALLVSAFGQYVFATAFLYFFGGLAEFGLDRLVLRDLSRWPEKKQKYLSNILAFRVCLSLIAYLAAGCLVKVLGYSQANVANVFFVGLSLLPQTLTQAYTSFFNSQEKMEFSGVTNFLTAFLTALIGVFLVKFYGLLGALVSLTLGLVLSLLFGIYLGKKLGVRFIFQSDFKFWQTLLNQAWPFALLTFLALVYLRVDIALLTRLTNDYIVGLYASAFKLVELGVVLPQALTLSLFPSFSRLMNKNQAELSKLYFWGLAVLFFLSLPLFLFVAFFPQPIINLLYGQKYLQATPALFILSFSLPLFFINALPANVILNSAKVKRFLPLESLKIVINVILNLLLIPRYSFVGSAWAMLISEGIGFLINNLFVYNILIAKENE